MINSCLARCISSTTYGALATKRDILTENLQLQIKVATFHLAATILQVH
jgi:hypothetical protein